MIIVHVDTNPDVLLETGRLSMRRVEQDDLSLFRQLFCDAAMMRYLGGVWSSKQATDALAEWRSEWGHNNYFYGVLVQKETGQPVGIAGFTENTNPHEPGYELTWFIHPEQQGKGYATEISLGLLEYIFTHLHGTRVFAETHPENTASNRILQKLGFAYLGRRQRQYDDLPGFNQQVVWEKISPPGE